ncbi:unnamed protein product [Tenebrio molitor]|jgi:hypothetical protein|nr:unnamed protein product [Tenebrio molitor]
MIDEKVLLGTFGLLLCSYVTLKTNRRRRRYKTRPINRQRRTQGSYNYFLKMKAADPEQFFKYTRMTVPVFEHLLSLVSQKISRGKRSDGICA